MDANKLEHLRPSPEELQLLPDKVRNYISALESEISSLARAMHNDSEELRRKRFAYWKR